MSSDVIFVYVIDSEGVGQGIKMTSGSVHTITNLVDPNGNPISIQYPLPTDSDSAYAKDIDVSNSIVTGWKDSEGVESADNILIPVTGLHTEIINDSATSPKVLLMHFERSINAHQVGLGCTAGGDFSNVKVSLLGSGGTARTVNDDSANNTKYTSRNYGFEPELFNAVKLEFLTTDPVCISNITIQKSVNVGAQIQGLRADGIIGTVNLTNGNNLKISLEELESGVSVNSNSQLRITPFSSDGTEYNTDPNTADLVVIDQDHHEIHEGDHYFVSGYDILANAAVLDLVIITPAGPSEMHYTADITSSAEVVAYLYEDITESGDGDAVVVHNNNRNSLNVAGVTITKDPTVTDLGTVLRTHSGGSTGPFAQGTSARSSKELIFKPSTKYLIRVVSGAGDNIVDWEIVWYEHAPVN